ncbi:CAP domain-containing protein [Luteolibacter pohnpeiensis]|uniref:CAP domain-containing protein n=1 Tax=Luteolibacter pohnpeiensis TaxID=454153 RepID=A0A934S6U1_9BACT|nr:CAP domain-containing protein [Luteolibacter pohnpeiensis]MBK1883292.1 CAP domain-containing protein [Luteolibacter pohnpeiensis]
MNIKRLSVLLATLTLSVVEWSCSPAQIFSSTPVAQQADRGESVEAALFREVNAWRTAHGVKPLQRHSGLDQLAREHSEFLRRNRGDFDKKWKKLSHADFDDRARIAQKNYQLGAFGENVVTAYSSGSSPAKQLLGLWVDSRPHARNMKAKWWTQTGIGVVVDSDGALFATQIFATEKPGMSR